MLRGAQTPALPDAAKVRSPTLRTEGKPFWRMLHYIVVRVVPLTAIGPGERG
jgi:hypothetical protein